MVILTFKIVYDYIRAYCSSGCPFSLLTILRYGKIIPSKNSIDFSVFDQWFSVSLNENVLKNLNFGRILNFGFPLVN